nr:hypothetical protein [Rhizobium leguminosarum]
MPVKRNGVLLRASPDTSSLFRPIANRSLELKNRIVMAPMTHLFAPEDVPGSASADASEFPLQSPAATYQILPPYTCALATRRSGDNSGCADGAA